MITTWVTLILVFTSTVFDIWTRRIPNYLTLTMLIVGLGTNFIYSGIHGLSDSFLGAVIGISLLFIPFVLGGIGAGDVKLLGAIGALNGLNFAFLTFLYSAISGGVIALIILLAKGRLSDVVRNLISFLKARFLGVELSLPSSSIKFPYGTAIMIGTVFAYLLR